MTQWILLEHLGFRELLWLEQCLFSRSDHVSIVPLFVSDAQTQDVPYP